MNPGPDSPRVLDAVPKNSPSPPGKCGKIDFVLFLVIPAKAGNQFFQDLTNLLDPRFHRGDGKNSFFSHLLGPKGVKRILENRY